MLSAGYEAPATWLLIQPTLLKSDMRQQNQGMPPLYPNPLMLVLDLLTLRPDL